MDHGILLSILEKYFSVTSTAPGLDTIIPSWTFSNLPDLTRKSSNVIVFFGLPRGTILSPLFYIVYTTYLETIIEKHGVKMDLYANDTQLYDHSRVNNIEGSVVTLEACLQDIIQWSSQRRLKLNPSKTELIWLDRVYSIEKLQQQPHPSKFPKIIKLSIGPRFGSDHRLWPDSGDTRLHPGTKLLLSVETNSTGEKKFGHRLSQNTCTCTCPCTCSLTSGLTSTRYRPTYQK